MARLSIENLPRPPKAFHPAHNWQSARLSSRFETKAKVRREDERRIASVKRLMERANATEVIGASRHELALLIKSIKSQSGPASARYMRKQRVRLTGSLWPLVVREMDNVSTFTLAPRGWEFQGGDLEAAEPTRLLNQIRSAFVRAGSSKSSGWAVLCLHGEHEPSTDKYVVHIHGQATGGMREVVDRLRSTRLLASKRHKGGSSKREEVYRRVVCSRKPLTNMPDPLTYLFQSFWPRREKYLDEAGRNTRQRKKRRIAEPYHTEVLLWLNRWRSRDLVLLIGLKVTKKGFQTTQRVYANSSQVAGTTTRKP